jgi:hypothetical protein
MKSTKQLLLFALFCVMVNLSAFSQSYLSLTRDSKKAYESQNFDESVFLAIEALMKKPNYEKAIEVLTLSLPAAVRKNEARINQLKESTATFKGDYTVEECGLIVKCYETLIKINEHILNLPPLSTKKGGPVKLSTKDYNADLREAKEFRNNNSRLAAEQHYQTGLTLLKINDIEKSKSAAKEFKRALSFVSDYRDARSKYEEARKLGIKRVAIIPFENKSGKHHYGAISEMMTDQIITDLLKDRSAMEFIEIVSRDQLQQVIQEQNLGMSGIISENTAMEAGKILGVHEIIVGQLTQITSNEQPTTSKTYKNERKIYSKQGDYMVYAAVTEYTKSANASVSGSYKIIDAKTARILKSDSFKEDYSFLSQWGTYSGSKDALDQNSYRLCSQREQTPPIDEERINIVARKLAASLVDTIIRYVK